jgi:small-conductance mechanosensitive channel
MEKSSEVAGRRGLWILLTIPLAFALMFLSSCSAQAAKAQAEAQSQTATKIQELAENEETLTPGEVMIEGRPILKVYEPIAGFSPQDRAERIAGRILAVAREGSISSETISTQPRTGWTEIKARNQVLMVVTDRDAELAQKPREALAAEDAANIRQALQNYRHDHTWNSLLKAIGYTAIVSLLLVPVLWLLRKVRLALRARLDRWIETRTKAEERKTPWHVGITYTVSLFIAIATVFRWLLVLTLLQAYLTLTMSFFPYTRSISLAVTAWLLSTLASLVNSGLEYLPNLIVVAVIIAIATQVMKLITMVFDEIAKGNLTVRGFYPDWAEPTAKLVRVLALVLVVVIIFPYLPGSKSPAFQGISIFVGVLLSLGSSSAVANGIAGVILTYMRSFLVGDWVKIGDTIGEVVEKNILVTRILTPKQEIITIPNATVMNGSVMNYTREAKNAGVIFHTVVTIGYDAPWKTVHQLLIDAAHATQYVLTSPAPFVLQTALNDFYVAYELNAYTDTPRKMQFIYSDLHQNIQDKFNDASVEICSPHFAALRDGNTISIPKQYVPESYGAPGFRVEDTRPEKVKTAGHAAD